MVVVSRVQILKAKGVEIGHFRGQKGPKNAQNGPKHLHGHDRGVAF